MKDTFDLENEAMKHPRKVKVARFGVTQFFYVPPQTLAAIVKASGKRILTKAQQDVILDAEKRWNDLREQLAQFRDQAVKAEYKRLCEQTEESTKSKEEISADFQRRRGFLKSKMREVCVEVDAILAASYPKLAEAGKIVAEKLEATEQTAAREFNVELAPSNQLKAAVAVSEFPETCAPQSGGCMNRPMVIAGPLFDL